MLLRFLFLFFWPWFLTLNWDEWFQPNSVMPCYLSKQKRGWVFLFHPISQCWLWLIDHFSLIGFLRKRDFNFWCPFYQLTKDHQVRHTEIMEQLECVNYGVFLSKEEDWSAILALHRIHLSGCYFSYFYNAVQWCSLSVMMNRSKKEQDWARTGEENRQKLVSFKTDLPFFLLENGNLRLLCLRNLFFCLFLGDGSGFVHAAQHRSVVLWQWFNEFMLLFP